MNEQLLSTLEHSRNYTLGVAEAMPEALYNSKPVDTVWNFGELMNHIAYGIEWWNDNYIQGIKTEWNPPVTKENKKQVLDYLNRNYDKLKTVVNNQTLKADSINGFHATLDHITHHRGQAVLQLRCQGIIPPEYIY